MKKFLTQSMQSAFKKIPQHSSTVLVWGWHVITSAMEYCPKSLQCIMASSTAAWNRINEIKHSMVSEAQKHRENRYDFVALKSIDIQLLRAPPGQEGHQDPMVHQHIWALVKPPEPKQIQEFFPEKGPLLVLDHITDPYNVGSLWRSGAALGAQGIILTQRHSPPLTGTLMKSASGACLILPHGRVVNLVRSLEILKKQGFCIAGLEQEGAVSITSIKTFGPVALVVGAEGEGLRRLTRETCDIFVKIPTAPNFGVLNAAVSGAIALSHLSPIYETSSLPKP